MTNFVDDLNFILLIYVFMKRLLFIMFAFATSFSVAANVESYQITHIACKDVMK